MVDLRGTAAQMPWPGPLEGLRCLDIGTMDGFWAFELERRGAAEVLATDIAAERQDALVGHGGGETGRGETFRVARDVIGSRAEYRS